MTEADLPSDFVPTDDEFFVVAMETFLDRGFSPPEAHAMAREVFARLWNEETLLRLAIQTDGMPLDSPERHAILTAFYDEAVGHFLRARPACHTHNAS